MVIDYDQAIRLRDSTVFHKKTVLRRHTQRQTNPPTYFCPYHRSLTSLTKYNDHLAFYDLKLGWPPLCSSLLPLTFIYYKETYLVRFYIIDCKVYFFIVYAVSAPNKILVLWFQTEHNLLIWVWVCLCVRFMYVRKGSHTEIFLVCLKNNSKHETKQSYLF